MIGLIILTVSAISIGAPFLFGLTLFLVDRLERIHPLLPFTLILIGPLIGIILLLCGI